MKVHIKTYGCSLNHADSETMAGALVQAGHEVTDEETADVVLFNTCTVKNPSQDHFLSTLKKQSKPVVVAGCIPQADKQGLFENHTTLGTSQLLHAPLAVEAATKKQRFSLQGVHEQRLNQPKVRANPLVEIVPICAGCLSSCTYCKTKQARGNLKSYRPMDIQQQVEQAVKEGVKEVWLTSQDNGAYGMDIGTNPGELLQRIAHIEGDFMIRFGMTNPDWTKKWLNELIEAYKHPKVYKFLHLPIQSGSDAVLKHMGRRCTAQDIRDIVKAFREAIPNITIATDIICGYPTETEEDFKQTLDLVNELHFPVINISKFYARPDTKAAKLKPLPSEEVKARSKKLTELFNTFNGRTDLLNETVQVTFVERKGQSNIGRTQEYTPVVVNSAEDLRGTRQTIKIHKVTRDDVRGVKNE